MAEEFLARGKRGLVFLREEDGRTVLIKRRNPAAAVDTIANEAHFTNLLNGLGIGPGFLRYDEKKGELVREYVKGEELRKWLPTARKAETKRLLLSLLTQCRLMDEAHVQKEEMTRPWKHVIVTPSGTAFLIDFERCREMAVPKNVTQFCHFLTGTHMTAALKEKKIIINNKKLLFLSKIYKQKLRKEDGGEESAESEKAFKELLSAVRHG